MAKKEREPTEYENWEADVPEGWQEDDAGLPPYWKPELGRSFRGTVLEYQEAKNDLDFDRFVILASEQMICQKGPADDAEDVIVMPGGRFTCSWYAALPLNEYLGFEVKVITHKTRKLPGNEASGGAKRDLWNFKILTSPETKKALQEFRLMDAERQRIFIRERRMTGLKKGNDQMKLGSGTVATEIQKQPF